MVIWMAGAGLKRGYVHGETDEIGLAAMTQKVSVPDWHATLLHLLGIDNTRLIVEQSGFEERLTGVEEPRIVSEILA
jgi:antirestriction protein ArdC